MSDRFKQILLKITIKSFNLVASLKKPAIFFLTLVFWPFKIIFRLFFKLILVNLYWIYWWLKKKIFGQFWQQKNFRLIYRYVPLVLIFCFGLWVVLDQRNLNKLSAEEIGRKSLLNKITTAPEDFDLLVEITEGPLTNQPDKIAYYDEGVISSEKIPQNILNEELPLTTQDETALVAPPINLPTESTRTEITEYTVQPGDTVSSIAKKFGITTNTILWSNDLSVNSLLKLNQKLKILPISGLTYKIAKGDQLASIAKKFQADADKILEFNKLASAQSLVIGKTIIIPHGVKPAVYAPAPAKTIKTILTPPSARISGTLFQWPTISRRISQYFGWRHAGVDIAAPKGDPVYAAENGKVETAGWNKGGYGYYIIINHGNGLKTLYGHNSKLLVSAGESVARGQVIGLVGSTGRSTGPHIHLEVTKNGAKVNPLSYVK